MADVQIWGFRDLDSAELRGFFRWCDLRSLVEIWELNAENTN